MPGTARTARTVRHERRLSPRTPCNLPATWAVQHPDRPGHLQLGRVIDISDGGLCLEVFSQPPILGSIITVATAGETGRAHIRGLVVSVETAKNLVHVAWTADPDSSPIREVLGVTGPE